MKFILLYLLIINATGFVYMLADKYRAKKNLWRIPESRLMLTALIGGSFGVFAGMHLARHKTKHPKFSIGVPVILALQVALAAVLLPQIKLCL